MPRKLTRLIFLLALAFGLPAHAQDDAPFTLAVIPDTQRYAAWNPAVFEAQTRWIADHAAERRIVFTVHLGDITENDTVPAEWEAASGALQILDNAGLHYLVVAGNHDIVNEVPDTERDLSQEVFLDYFPVSRDEAMPTFGGASATAYNRYHIFSGGAQEFLVLGLDYRVSGQTLDWAQSVLDAHPTLPVILVSHDIVTSVCELGDESCHDGGGLTENGKFLWENFIRRNDQIFLTINGHSWPPERLTLLNDAGRAVHLILTNYQAEYYGGNGHLRLLEFDLAHNVIRATTFSPWVMQKAENRRGPSDLLEKTDARNQFEIEIDFAARFAGFGQ